MKDIKKIDRLILKYLLLLGILAIVLLNLNWLHGFLLALLNILRPIILGFVLAYIVNILMVKIEALLAPQSRQNWLQKIRRPLAMVLSYILIVLVIYLVLSLIIPQLYSVIVEFIDLIPLILTSIKQWVIENENLIPQLRTAIENADVQVDQIMANLWNVANDFTSNIVGTTLTTVGSVFALLVNGLLSFMISLYVLLAKERLANQSSRILHAYLPQSWVKRIYYVLDIVNDSFKHFISGEVVEAFILGIMVTLGMWVLQFPYAGMIGALTGFTALIPLVGAYISGIIGFLLIFVQDPLQGLMFLVFIIILQQVEGNLIYPKVVGSSLGLPGIWVLISITLGGGLWGVVGMLIAVPLASAIYRLIANDVHQRESGIPLIDEDNRG
ncbi:AI-2E family transporter [Ignavigranum ruoffiae]|uniref:AI-2E family transporter n=1 Tax=Ignavigranum ruoffiae TaxID=89093 RepID=UPI0024ADCBBF|nr:AI-2E family transporter [Ignavigranum ruoffiae]